MPTYDERIAQSSDDGRLLISGPTFDNSSNGIFMGPAWIGFFRFQDLPMSNTATINSATIKILSDTTFSSGTMNLRIYGIAEDDTATFSSNPSGRTKTTAYVDWNFTYDDNVVFTSPDISSVVQEIIERSGFSPLNSIGLRIESTGGDNRDFLSYDANSATAARLEIDYTGITTRFKNFSAIALIENPLRDYGIKIIKPTFELLTDNDPSHQIYNSDYDTLKYFLSGTIQVSTSEGSVDWHGREFIDHDLGFYPYIEVFVDMLGNGDFTACPAIHYGASIIASAGYRLTDTQLELFHSHGGFSTNTATFKYFIFRNDLGF